jgi:hypothetical protein
MQSHPDRLLGVFVADPTVTEPEKWMEDITKSHENWVARRTKNLKGCQIYIYIYNPKKN